MLRGCVDAARARAKMAPWAVALRGMRPGGAHGPCPAGLTSVEYRSKRGGFSCASTSTPLQAAAHGFSMHVSGLGARCYSTTSQMASCAVALRTMRPAAAHGPYPASLTLMECRSERGGFSRASTSTPLQAAAHGFSTDASGLGGCCQSTATDGSVGCGGARHAAWRRSWAVPGRPDIGGAPQ